MPALTLYLVMVNLSGLAFSAYQHYLHTMIALARMAFFMVQSKGIKAKKSGGYIQCFFQPAAFSFPLNIPLVYS